MPEPAAELATEVLEERRKSLRADLADPDVSHTDVELMKRHFEYHTLRNEKLYSQLVFFERVVNLFFFFIVIIAIALPFPNYETVSAEYIYSILLMVATIAFVKYRFLLAAQVYLLNLFTYFEARSTGSVYQPYIVYGFMN